MGSGKRTQSLRPRGVRAALAAALVLALGSAGGSASAREAAPVVVAEARERELVEELALTGSLSSPRNARLSAEVAGRVARLEVEEGDRVEAGATLVALDAALARHELAQARASVREAKAELEDAGRRLAEIRELAERNSAAATRVRDREAEVRRDRAVLERREAERAYREALLERHTLEAPFAGVVHRRLTELGEWVEPGSPVLELVATDRLRLDLEVPQAYFGRVEAGTPVRVHLDARPERTLESRVHEVVPVSDPSARTFLTRVRLENDAGRMTPGMSARATLRIATGRRGVVVPRDALIRHPDGRVVVWVAEGAGEERTVRARRVRTGLAFGESVAIREGLETGSAVVVRGNEALQEGQRVRVRSAPTAAVDS